MGGVYEGYAPGDQCGCLQRSDDPGGSIGRGDGMPDRTAVLDFVVGQAEHVSAVQVHDVDFRVAVLVVDKGDFLAVGRPDGSGVLAGRHIRRENQRIDEFGSVYVHD